MGSAIGHLFRVTTFGESHGAAIGGVVEGCPPGIALDMDAIQAELVRRRPGGRLSSPRKELDEVEILSGVFEGKTLGTAIGLLIRNKDADPRSYAPFADRYRPSHADYTYDARYGRRDWRGGGRASARETAIRVAAGAIARQVLTAMAGIEIVGWVEQVGGIVAGLDPDTVQRDAVEASEVRCPDPVRSAQMVTLIEDVRRDKDTVGGVVRCVARGVPAGLGDPVFDKLEADLAKACMSLPAAKGFSSGTGFAAAAMRGSAHNDPFIPGVDGPRTTTNHSGGIQGGISNGMPVLISVAFKPVATIFKSQQTVDTDGNATTIQPRGRHDPCVVARAVPIVEAAMAMTLCDHFLRHRAIRE
ncbi:MAG: chorismate synthase [Myxococcota bacterium]|jgi:chorismate synthase